MPRRALTLIVAGVAVVVAAVVAAVLPVPYVVLSPGPTLNTLGRGPGGQPLIQIQDHPVHPTTGDLNLVTVNFQGGPGDEINIFTALRAWLNPQDAVVPQSEVFGSGQTPQQVQQQDTQQMAGSQQTATAAALTELKIPFTTQVQVVSTEPGMPAASVLKAGDLITAVNGTPVASLAALSARIGAAGACRRLQLTVTRNRKTEHLGLVTVKIQGLPPSGSSSSPRTRSRSASRSGSATSAAPAPGSCSPSASSTRWDPSISPAAGSSPVPG